MRYLEDLGFAVRAYRSPLDAPREGTLVWLADHASDDRVVIETVKRWIAAKAARAIVVSKRPVRLKEAIEDAPGRVVLLAAPVFGWQLVDALRDEAFASR